MALGFAESLLSVCGLSAAWAAGGEGRHAGPQLGESPVSSPCYCPRDTGVRFPGSLRVACPARGCKAAVWVGSACSWSGLAPTALGGGQCGKRCTRLSVVGELVCLINYGGNGK